MNQLLSTNYLLLVARPLLNRFLLPLNQKFSYFFRVNFDFRPTSSQKISTRTRLWLRLPKFDFRVEKLTRLLRNPDHRYKHHDDQERNYFYRIYLLGYLFCCPWSFFRLRARSNETVSGRFDVVWDSFVVQVVVASTGLNFFLESPKAVSLW